MIFIGYDTQEEVYAHARKLSFEALDLLNKTGENGSQAALATGDAFLYGGNVSKWKKFVYGVLARTHHHLSNKSIYKADSVLYYTNLAMKETSDDALVKFAATTVSATNNFFGPFRNNLGGATITAPTAIRQSAFIADLMSGLNPAFSGVADQRAIYLLRKNANGTYTFTPVLGYFGSVPAITYSVADPNGASASAILAITVTPVNDPPIVVNESINIQEDIIATGNLLTNDSDPEQANNLLTITQFTIAGISGTFTASSTAIILALSTGLEYVPVTPTLIFT